MDITLATIAQCDFCGDSKPKPGFLGVRSSICRPCLSILAEVAVEAIAIEEELGLGAVTPASFGCPFCGIPDAHPLILGNQQHGAEIPRICLQCIRAAMADE